MRYLFTRERTFLLKKKKTIPVSLAKSVPGMKNKIARCVVGFLRMRMSRERDKRRGGKEISLGGKKTV